MSDRITRVLLGAVFLSACAHSGAGSSFNLTSQTQPIPSTQRLLHELPNNVAEANKDIAGLTHILRGLYHLHQEQPAAAADELRLALIYDRASPFLYERLSQSFRLTGDTKAAIRTLRRGLHHSPNDPQLNLDAGEAALGTHHYAEAIAHFEKARRAKDMEQQTIPFLLDALLWSHKSSEASHLFKQALLSPAIDVETLLAMAVRFEDHGELKQALQAYQMAHRQQPSDKRPVFGEVRVLDLLDRGAEAADRLIDLFKHFPDDPLLYVELSRLMRRASSADFESYRLEAIKQAGQDPTVLVWLAVVDLEEGSIDDGVALLHEVLKRYATHEDIRLMAAQVLESQNRPAACVELVAHRPLDSQGLTTRARCYAKTGELQQAMQNLSLALHDSQFPLGIGLEAVQIALGEKSRTKAHVAWSAIRQQLLQHLRPFQIALLDAIWFGGEGLGDRAMAHMNDAMRAAPDDLGMKLRYAQLQALYGDPDQAVEELESLVVEDPEDPLRLNALGFILADSKKDLNRAEVYLRRAYRYQPRDGYVVDNRLVISSTGENPRCLHFLERAARITPTDPEVQTHLAEAYLHTGNLTMARRAFEAALEAQASPRLRRLVQHRLTSLKIGNAP
ncbi:MAG: tetratricopeptide repeat protein [Myxococcota bacterium]